MPALAPVNAAPVDSIEIALEMARVRLNDFIIPGGDVLTDLAAFTPTVVNAGWRRLQEFLTSIGFAMFKKEAILYNCPTVSQLPPATAPDPAAEVRINWSQYFDGANYFPATAAPVLPPDMISPLEVRERLTVASPAQPGVFLKMDRLLNGLPGTPQQYRNWRWQWRDLELCLPGATSRVDLWLYYSSYFPDFMDQGDVPFYKAKIPIPRAALPLAWYIASEMTVGRGGTNRDYFDTQAQMEATHLSQRELLQPRSIGNAAEYGRMPNQWTPNGTPAPSVKQ